VREPLWIIALAWPFVMLLPHLPGLPTPSISDLPWRQELGLALLLSATFAFALRRVWAGVETPPDVSRVALSVLLPGSLFTAWSAASALWATHPYPAVHYALQWGAYTLFFTLICRVAASSRMLRASLFSLGAVVWLLGVSCAIESWCGATLTDGSFRSLTKPLFRANSGFGEMMAVAAPIFAALCLCLRKPQRALMCGATALVAWLATLQAIERAPIIGGVAGLLLLLGGVCLLRNCRPVNLRRAVMLFGALALITVVEVVPAPLSFLQTAPATQTGAATQAASEPTALTRLLATSTRESNMRVRFLFWGIGLEMLRANPLAGVGANNYEVAYPEARQRFSAARPHDAGTNLNEALLARHAHSEYVQILAELGLVGFVVFASFCVGLIVAFRQALRRSRRPLLALGAGGGLLAFALSSGASPASFRWMGSSLLFFFAAALVSHCSSDVARRAAPPAGVSSLTFARASVLCSLALALAMSVGSAAQCVSTTLSGMAQTSSDQSVADRLYRAAVSSNPHSAPTHYAYGLWLYRVGRTPESLSHLRYAVARGFNSSTCYAYLAAAEAETGDLPAAEQTLAKASEVYPRSVFLRARHAAALAEVGKPQQAEQEFAAAVSLDERAARGWQQLISFGSDTAALAARADPRVAIPGELSPKDCVRVIILENERRLGIIPRSKLLQRAAAQCREFPAGEGTARTECETVYLSIPKAHDHEPQRFDE
jgi:O-antigen ligase